MFADDAQPINRSFLQSGHHYIQLSTGVHRQENSEAASIHHNNIQKGTTG